MKAYFDKSSEEMKDVAVLTHKFVKKAHFHCNVEVMLVGGDKCTVMAGGKVIELKNGDIALFDSYDVHSLLGGSVGVRARLVMIPPSLLNEYYAYKGDRKFTETVINDKGLCNKLIEIVDKFIDKTKNPMIKNSATKLLLALVSDRFPLSGDEKKNETGLVQMILNYLSVHYKEKITLTSLSTQFGYAEEHISRVFHNYINEGIPQYLNGLRYNYIETQSKYGKRMLSELVFESGFGSMQTYYRYKAKILQEQAKKQ